jgi:hypothetical protein
MTKGQAFLRSYAIGATLLIGGVVLGSARPSDNLRLRELTVERITVVDTTGRERVLIAGSFPPRRDPLAGLLFVNSDGGEAGGLVYRGARKNGRVSASGTLTMDQYNEDQVVALQYDQDGDRRSSGLTIVERPTRMGPELGEFYRVLDPMPEGPARDSIQRVLWGRVPLNQRSARRLFVGRDTSSTAMVELKDRAGVPRLRLAVDSLGTATISFLDGAGRVVKTIGQ